eukprot:c23920_g3_i1 orf=1-1179(-)
MFSITPLSLDLHTEHPFARPAVNTEQPARYSNGALVHENGVLVHENGDMEERDSIFDVGVSRLARSHLANESEGPQELRPGFAMASPRVCRVLETVRSSDCLEGLLLNISPSFRSGAESPRSEVSCFEPHPMFAEAWVSLRKSIVNFQDKPVGTIAASDHSEEALNYDQVFVRDFVPSALAFLMNNEPEIVKNFLCKALRLQSNWEKRIDNFTLGKGAMPASFKVLHDSVKKQDRLMADFGESAIGRVAPVDSGFWWIILLRAYTKSTGDMSLADAPDCQRGIRLVLNLCLSEGFDTFPTLLCADGCSMIDRRMGIYGYPIEIQALFHMALRCAKLMLKPTGDSKELLERIDKRLQALNYHIRSYFWLDFQQLNNVYRYKTEEYSHTAVNKFN